MNYWIFQGNPDVFDIDTYLKNNSLVRWSVNQAHYAPQMHTGDEMFLWKSAGRNKAKSGIVAFGRLLGEPQLMPDDAGSEGLWSEESDSSQVMLRIDARIEIKCLESKRVIRRE